MAVGHVLSVFPDSGVKLKGRKDRREGHRFHAIPVKPVLPALGKLR